MNAKVRQQVLERDNFCCRDCGYDAEAEIAKQIKAGARDHKQAIKWEYERLYGGWNGKHLLEVDHEIPRFYGGEDDPDLLVAVCIGCHKKRTRERDMPRFAKTRRLRKANAEHAEKMKEKAGE